MSDALVSIVMNCHNGREFLRESIQSVLDQTYKNWELIFVDNASSDDSAEIVKSYNDSRIRYLRIEKKVSLGEARNFALKNYRGDFLTFLDTDDVYFRKKIELQIGFFEKNPNVDFLYTGYKLIGNVSPLLNFRLFLMRPHIFNPTGNVLGRFLRKSFVNLPTVMFRVDLLSNGLQFDSRLSHSEEFLFFAKLFTRCEVGYLEQVTVNYRIHQNQLSQKGQENYVSEAKIVLEDLRGEIDTNSKLSQEDLNFFQSKIDYWKFLTLIKNNNFVAAKDTIKAIQCDAIEFKLLKVIAKMPDRLVKTFMRLWNQYS